MTSESIRKEVPPLPSIDNLVGLGKLPLHELAKVYENLGHDSLDNPEIAGDLLDKATALRVQANKNAMVEIKAMRAQAELEADENAVRADASAIADKIGMSPEKKAKFMAEVESVLVGSRDIVSPRESI
jgi:hypothetical protein